MEFPGPKPAGSSRQSKLLLERRTTARLAVHSPAYTSLDGSPPDKARDLSEIVDIGEGGISIQTSSALEVDRNLDLCLDLSETKARINTTGRVVWSNGAGRAGIRFQKMAGQSLRQLREWLFVNVLTAFDHTGAGSASSETSARGRDAVLSPRFRDLQNALPNRGPRKQPESVAAEVMRESLIEAEADAAPRAMQNELNAGGLDLPVPLQIIADRALTVTRATGAAIALSTGEEMICEASAGSDAPPVGSRLQASSGFSGECVRTARSLRCDDSETDDRVDRAGCRALGVRSIVAVPIRRGNRVAGLIEVFSSQPYAFTPEDISVLQQLSSTISSVAGNKAEAHAPAASLPRLPQQEKRAARVEERFEERIEERIKERNKQRPIETPPIAARTVEQNYPQARAIEDQRTSDVMAGTLAAVEPSARSQFHKILLAAAALTFLLSVMWLVAPWIASRTRQAHTNSEVNVPQTGVAKPVTLPSEVNDLTGLRKLAEQGDPAAQFALGARYATGEEVKQDYTEAVRWFGQAADRGHILAQATLGAYYWAGRGVTPDLTKAYFWSALAQAGGDQASKYRVAVLTSRMSRSQILAAQQQANDWLRNHQTGNTSPSR
jgi:GAF domain-containing protein